MLAQTVMLGEHGRKRAGQGDEFWQYRAAHAGDSARAIDWRRSARADTPFVREREWQAAQSVTLWADPSRSMGFSGDAARPTKGGRAKVLALALGILLLKGGERVGLAGQPPRPGRAPPPGAGVFFHLPPCCCCCEVACDGATWSHLETWKEKMSVFKICQPCRAYNLFYDPSPSPVALAHHQSKLNSATVAHAISSTADSTNAGLVRRLGIC